MAAPAAKSLAPGPPARAAASRAGARSPGGGAAPRHDNAVVGNLQLAKLLGAGIDSKPEIGNRGGTAVGSGGGNLALAATRKLGRTVSAVGAASDVDEMQADRVAQNWAARAPPAATWTTSPDGGSLAPAARRDFEAAVGADLCAVRIHAGPQAKGATAILQAAALAHGSDVYVNRDFFVQGSAATGRLLAHELAHVARDPAGTRVRRQLLTAGATDADNDQRLLDFMQSQPSFMPIDVAREIEGLTGWRRRMPLSYAEMRMRAVAMYAAPTIAFLESHDGTVLGLVTKAHTVVEQLVSLRQQVESDTPEDEAARAVIDHYIGTQDLFGNDPPGQYEISYSYFALHLSQDSRFDLRLHQAMLAGSVEDLVADVSDVAGMAAQEASALRLQREAWTQAATALVGRKVAHRSGIFWDTAYLLETLCEPIWGSENWDDMTALARLGGHAAAVMRIGSRYHVFNLDENFSRTDVFAARDWDQASLVLDDTVPGARTVEIVTRDGFVLSLREGAEVMFGGDQARRPLEHLEADTRLAQASDEERHGIGPEQLFQSMVRNLALVNLQRSEQRLNSIVSSMQSDTGFGVDPRRGESLQRASARLRELTLQSRALGDQFGENPPTPQQVARRDELMSETGQLIDENPAAAFFVAGHQVSIATWFLAPPAAAIERAAGGIDDQLAGMQGGDAAARAIEVARERLANIATVRRAMFDQPEIVLGFETLFDQVNAYFSDSDKRSIRISLFFRSIDEVAHSVRMAGVDLGLLIAGFFTEGGTWAALGVEAAGVAYGAAQLQDQYARTQLTIAMAALDVPGGFELASAEAAASAQHWLWISAGLNFLGVLGLARTAGRLMRQSAEDAALLGRLARRAGVSEEAMAGAFRTSWRGARAPEPGALREILLARLPDTLRQRYAQLEIVVLDDAQWAARYPQNPMGNAAITFRVPRGGGVEAESVAFRAGGNPMAMQEEAEHILQAQVGEHAGLLQDLVVASQDWSHLSLEQRMEATASVLEVEANAQERLLGRAQASHDTVAMDDAFEEMQEINRRQVELERAIGDPQRRPPDWFDPTHPPDSLFATPRMPRSRGSWSDPSRPGNSAWISTRPEVRTLAPEGVEFVNGYPNFRPWSVAEVRIDQAGLASDFAEADLRFARRIASGEKAPPAGFTRDDFMHNGEAIAVGTERYRQAEKLTWHHHQGGTVMLLVPTKLHAKIPHTGGASAARAASP